MTIRQRIFTNCALLLFTANFANVVLSQIKSGTITGTITDSSNSVIPGALVTVTNQETNIAREVKTNSAGDYTVPYLEAGRFAVTVKANGFDVHRSTDIALGTGTTLRIDARLTPGALTTAVDVKADAVALQTENATVQGSVNANLIANLPNINNNPLYYATLQAGVVPAPQLYTSSTLGVGYADRQAMSAIRINGGQVGSNDVQLDGLSVQGAAWHETSVVPDRDTLQEVRVTTNSFAADLGNGQGLISMITKSGTNDFHGTLRYRLRNEALNANGLNNNLRGIARPKYRLNEGGGTIGGPVVIPKLYNGKDKLFFFASFFRLTHSDPVNYQTRVPTDFERKGDFSQTKVASNSGAPVPVQIFDPYTASSYQGSATVFIRQPFPNAIVTNPSPFGLKVLQAYPAANQTPTDAFSNNNYYFAGTAPTVRNALSSRVDYRPGVRNSIYISGGFSVGKIDQPNKWGPTNPFVNMTFPGVSEDKNPYAAVGDTITLNQTTVMDIRYGATHIRTNSSYPSGSGFDNLAYGMPKEVLGLAAIPGTALTVGNFGGPIAALNSDSFARKREAQMNHVLAGSITKTVSRLTLKAGGEYRVYLGNWQDLRYGTPRLNGGNNNGQLGNINGGNSALITDPALRGISFATALTGAGGFDLAAGTSTRPALAAKYMALFSQNDWKATSKLTINLGIRFEVQPGPTERYNRLSGIDLGKSNPYTAGATLSSPSGGLGFVAFPGTAGYSRNLWDTQWNNFSPRVGVAYRITSTTVLRGGYGRAYTPSNTGFNANSLIYGTGPFSGGAINNAYGLTPNGLPVGRWENSANTIIIPAPGANQSPAIYGNNNSSLGVDLIPRNYRNGAVDQWNFFIEHTLRNSWIVAAGYVGSRGFDLAWRGFPLAGTFSVPDAKLQTWRSAWLASNGLGDPASVQGANPLQAFVGKATGNINNANISALDAQKPYLSLLGQTYLGNAGRNNYNALQLRAEHAFSNGFQALVNYTWSKATGLTGGSGSSSYAESQVAGIGTTAAGGIDYRNLDNNRGLLGYDTSQRAVVAASYDLPFGKGRRFSVGKIPDNFIGGWRLGSAVTLQSGQPWGPSCGGLTGRCNTVSGEQVEVPKELQHWYDGKTSVTLPNGRTITPAAFTFLKWNNGQFAQPVVQFPNGNYQVDQYFTGTTSMYVKGLRTPGFYNTNLMVNRQFKFADRMQLELLAEATNVLNKTNFNPNSVNGAVGSVLQANAATNTKVGQNSNVNFGTMSASFFEPRQLSLSLRLRF